VRVDHLGYPSPDGEAFQGVLVHPDAGGYRTVIDSVGVVPAPTLGTLGSRVAHAWSLQNFRLLGAAGDGRRRLIATRRDVRARVGALAPFFVQGGVITPVLASDSLHWVLELYASSATYPLSTPVNIAGDVRRYFRHAATAIVDAATGEVQLVRTSQPDPLAASWFERFPGLFITTAEISRDLAERLPPVDDAALVQATIFARYGHRRESSPGGALARQASADSTAGAAAPTRVVLPLSSPAATWVQPVLDSTDRVRGLILATGGVNRATLWMPGEPSARRWPQLIDRIEGGTDSVPAPREGRWERGPVRALPVTGGVAYTQTTYVVRASAPPVIGFVAVLAGDSLAIGPTLSQAAGVIIEPDASGPVTAQDFRARVDALYAAMRSALQRGDWTGFGEAFESLGVLLQSPRPLAPPARPR
jgi:hypothetical protein